MQTRLYPSLGAKYEHLAEGQERTKQILTIHDGPPMLDETVDNFEGLSGGRQTLIVGQPIQPLDRRLDVPLSAKLPHKFLCPIE